jgi:hypothetical protein
MFLTILAGGEAKAGILGWRLLNPAMNEQRRAAICYNKGD